MGIYITGDLHGDYTRFEDERLSKLGKNDFLIVCGDFGFIWAVEKNSDDFEIKVENHHLDDIEKTLPYTLLFIDGNHENFDRLEAYPEVAMFGGKVRKIRENIFHLQRGRVYTVEGKRFFCFGGAASIDKYMRIENVSWWARELPQAFEYDTATQSLKDCDFKLDYIITHTAPVEVVKTMGFNPYLSQDMELMSYLSYVMEKTDFQQWFFGHWHTDESIELTNSNLFSRNRKSGESIKSQVKSFIAIYKNIAAVTD